MRISFRKWILLQLVLLALSLSAAHAAPPASLILGDKLSYDLSGYMEILNDPTRRLTVQQAASSGDWAGPVRESIPNLGFTQSAIWVRFILANQMEASRKFYVSFEYPVADSVTLYAKTPHGVFREQRAGDSVPASAQVVPDRHFLFPLSIGPGETSEVYVRIQSTASMTIPLRILTERALSLKAIRDYLVYGALFGLLALLLVYFISVGARLYEGSYLWFTLYSIFFGLHTAVRGGFTGFLMPDRLVGINNVLNLLIIGGLFFTGAKFFRVFLSLKNYSKPFDLIMTVFQYLSIPFVLFSLFSNPISPLISFFLLVVNPAFSIALSFYFWRKGVANAGYFAFGWIVAHFVSVYDFFRITGALPYSPFGEWPIPFSLLVALLFFATALIRQNTSDLLMARIDPLTGLANRRKLDEALEGEWNRCLRQRIPLSLIMIDVDHFKEYNDSFGHKAGDQCLCRITDTIKRHARRAGDLAVRFGGEEFVLLLPNLDAAKAFDLAETIRNSVECSTNGGGNQRPGKSITISLGVANTIPKGGIKPESLVLEADKAMYEAKHAGRNRTVASSSAGI
jgi:two-component system, sensor histidine kinase LadS